MGDRPMRVQLSRRKGWRMPPNTVSVARPGRWGNPFTVTLAVDSGYTDVAGARVFVVECFRDWLGPLREGRDWWQGPESDARKAAIHTSLAELRGKNLACWCPLDQPCHADVLLDLATASPEPRGTEPAL
jgi:hypothetical protein